MRLPLLPFLDVLAGRGPSANARRATIAGLLRGEVTIDRGADVLGRSVTGLVPALGDVSGSGVLIDANGGTALAFRHPLIREALYAALPTAVGSALHRVHQPLPQNELRGTVTP